MFTPQIMKRLVKVQHGIENIGTRERHRKRVSWYKTASGVSVFRLATVNDLKAETQRLIDTNTINMGMLSYFNLEL